MLLIYIFISIHNAFGVNAYANNQFFLVENTWNVSGCGGFTDQPTKIVKPSIVHTTRPLGAATVFEEFTFSTIAKPPDVMPDPYVGFQATLNKVLFGDSVDMEETYEPNATSESLEMYPSGQMMRAEIFQNKSMVHLPRHEWMHPGHCFLNTSTPDFMQTAVNAFAIFLQGSLSDVLKLPATYVLRSARTIAMMKIAREKLVATWKVVKGNQRTEDISYHTLEYYRPLFKYINGREMSRLDLNNDRILSFIGTHSDLDRHQVGVVASEYIKRNLQWDTPKYLNLMNNLLCGVPMKFMRRIPENVYLQLSHQLFYHIKACDPLQRRFYLAMMTRTQVLGKSNSWGARDVARLGLLLTEVDGSDLSAMNPEAMAGIAPQVMMGMPARNLKYLTETQVRYLSQKTLNIMTKKLHAYESQLQVDNACTMSLPNLTLYFIIAIKLVA